MGRRKIQEETDEDEVQIDNIYPHGILTCPVCGNDFEATDETRYIVHGGYTCSLKCFFNRVKDYEARKGG